MMRKYIIFNLKEPIFTDLITSSHLKQKSQELELTIPLKMHSILNVGYRIWSLKIEGF